MTEPLIIDLSSDVGKSTDRGVILFAERRRGVTLRRLAGENAGAVLGTALAIKMVAYVLVAPIVGGLAGRLPRRAFLVSMDLTRAAVAIALPFIDHVWQIYALIFVLQSASAAFTPTFQATIPDVLPEERD